MELSVPCTWDEKLIDGIDEINRSNSKYKITEVFGSLKSSVIGSSHSSLAIGGNCRDKKNVENFVAKLHEKNLTFNYTINSNCLGNKEFDFSGQRKIVKELEWISSFSDSVTLAVPYLMDLIRQIAGDKLEIVMSITLRLRTLRKIQMFEEMGAGRIILDRYINWNIPEIKKIRQRTNSRLEILVNDSCLYECPFQLYHNNMGSHGSQTKNSFHLDYCGYNCFLKRLENPAEILKSRVIRPEDLSYYEDDIDIVKIAGREKTTDWVLNTSNAYAYASYKGNLMDLFTLVTPDSLMADAKWLVNKFAGKAPKFYLDNQRVESFMKPFLNNNKECFDCRTCNYCETFIRKNLVYDKQYLNEYLEKYKEMKKFLFLNNKKMNYFKYLLAKFCYYFSIKTDKRGSGVKSTIAPY